MYWNARMECMPPEELRNLQYRELKSLVYKLYSFNNFYRDRMDEHGVHPDDIQSLEDIRRLPFMYKQDLRDNYPCKMFTSPREEVVRYHVSSGTTGKPTLVGYTESDIEFWTDSLARALTSIGIGRGDVVQVSYGYGLFTGGLGLHYGAERVGATVLPASVGNTERQLELMMDLDVTAIACTPSYMIHMGEVAKRLGIDFRRDTKLRKAILGAEPWSEGMRRHIQEDLGIEAYDIYGTSEISGPMFTECEERNGIHIWGDVAIVEIIDPETEEPLPPGQEGELVITVIKKEAMPMVRYRIRDLTYMEDEVCPCGRSSVRMGRISGRSDDMLIIRGINVFPSQVEHTLMNIPEVGEQFMIILDRKGALDTMTVQAELRPEHFSDKMADMMAIKKRIDSDMRKYLNISVNVELMDPGSLPRFEGKAKRVVDRREF